VQMTAPDRERGVPNRELGTVERVNAEGRMEVQCVPRRIRWTAA
jgi:hypothetical protein